MTVSRMTITEALAEIKVIDSRVEKKRDLILSYSTRQNLLRDPLESGGGSKKVLKEEQQAVKDLLERKVTLRRAIARANEATLVTVLGQTRPIADWLVWKREVAPKVTEFHQKVRQAVDQRRREAQQRQLQVAADASAAGPTDMIVNVDERELNNQIEAVEATLQTLDGQLSLKNATVVVEVA